MRQTQDRESGRGDDKGAERGGLSLSTRSASDATDGAADPAMQELPLCLEPGLPSISRPGHYPACLPQIEAAMPVSPLLACITQPDANPQPIGQQAGPIGPQPLAHCRNHLFKLDGGPCHGENPSRPCSFARRIRLYARGQCLSDQRHTGKGSRVPIN
jgi:hypothetical protein